MNEKTKIFEKRILKIYASSNYNKKTVAPKPCITLQGDWVEELGYNIGKKLIVNVTHENNRNIIFLKLITEDN